MVYCNWCAKSAICSSRRAGPTVCGEFEALPGVFPFHTISDLPPEVTVDDEC